MGIMDSIFKHTIGKKIDRSVGYALADASTKVCDAINKKMIEANEKNENAFFDGATNGHSRLIINQKPHTFKESFQIFDEHENIKYIVQGKSISATHDLTVYDASGKTKLGRVKEKLISWRFPFSMEANPQDFVFEIGGQKLGKMKSQFSFGKRKFKFTFNNWTLEGNIWGLKYNILDGQEKVMEVSEKVWGSGDTYYIDIANPDNELLCILILLALDSSHTSKSSENKRTMARRLKDWL